MLPLFGVLWISWGDSHISIRPWCCDGMPCWVILIEILWKWWWYNGDSGCSLPICFIKWIPVPFIGLGQTRRDMTPICFIHSYMRYMVAGRLGSLLLPTLLVICLCSIVRQNVRTGNTYIPCLWLIYLWSVGEQQDLTRPPYIGGFVWDALFLQKYWSASLDLHHFLFIWWALDL